MEQLRFILTVAGLFLALASTIITAIAKNSKAAKIAKTASNLLLVIEAIQTFVTEAETIVGFTGANKKEWVMTKVNQYCIQHNIEYDSQKVSDKVEELLDFSHKVNAKKEEVL